MIGVQDEAAWASLAKTIARSLLSRGWDRCWTKSSVEDDSALRYTLRRDLLYCLRTSPAFMLADFTSYITGGDNSYVFVHRVCEDGGECQVPSNEGPSRHGGGRLRKDAIYPVARCLAHNRVVPCPQNPLETILAMVHSGLNTSCIALPTPHGRDMEDSNNRRLAAEGLCRDDVDILRERAAQLEDGGFKSMAPYFDRCASIDDVLATSCNRVF